MCLLCLNNDHSSCTEEEIIRLDSKLNMDNQLKLYQNLLELMDSYSFQLDPGHKHLNKYIRIAVQDLTERWKEFNIDKSEYETFYENKEWENLAQCYERINKHYLAFTWSPSLEIFSREISKKNAQNKVFHPNDHNADEFQQKLLIQESLRRQMEQDLEKALLVKDKLLAKEEECSRLEELIREKDIALENLVTQANTEKQALEQNYDGTIIVIQLHFLFKLYFNLIKHEAKFKAVRKIL